MIGLMPIFGIQIIQYLVFRPGLKRGPFAGADPIDDPAIGALGDLPFETELEVAELSDGDEVAGVADGTEHAFLSSPSRTGIRAVERAPSAKALAIEQGTPAVRSVSQHRTVPIKRDAEARYQDGQNNPLPFH